VKRVINAAPTAPPLRLVVLTFLIVSLVVFGTRSPQGAAFATGARGGLACGSWTVVPSPNAESGSTLTGVTAVSQGDAWAVGSSSDGSVSHTLAERWSGSGWSIESTPNVGTRTNGLGAVAATSKIDAWAVGFYDDGTTFRTLAERWNGSSWSVVNTPNAGAGQNILTAVAAISGTDVWAVGYRQDAPNSPRLTLAEHWNGSVWSVVTTPNVGTDENFLWSITARSTADVWAVGAYSVPWFQTLTEHWDGMAWKVVASPNLGNGNNVLYGAVRVGSRAVVAVGTWLDGDTTDTLAQRWNGTAWTVVPSPSPAGYINWLSGVAAAGAKDLWAVGWRSNVPFGVQHTLAEHWNGSSWSVVKSPNKGTEDNQLATVARIPGTASFWAVGHYEHNFIDRTLVLFHC
jgi:hypothetical protein